MAWDHLDIDKPHLAYMILGGFTGLFMLCSLFVKEKLYIGEATVATLCGIIFGPHAANLFNPLSWGNVDKITLECSRIVLVVQCFAVGVELPKAYMERHWRSVFLLLVPVMTWGWLITSLFIWWLVEPLSWIESLVCAACVTATDPVLASSVVGKGKFAKRVPKHLRDLLSAESGCNDGMAFPFIYLSFYILRYMHHPNEVALHWICVTILYECVLGAIFGFVIGYLARHAIKLAERKGLIDRESFLVFYFVLAVFCAGSGSLLGMDDLLIGFAAGVGFSNDGWFTEKTEESHVSNVIDLLLNLAYFVYLGAIVPWEDFNNPSIGLVPWRLVAIALLIIFFRRIPIMLALKPIIPDVKTWREALFAGHFGPIGVGAIFACILARAELETDSTQPLTESELPKAGTADYYVVQLIWPITAFMVISSILVHGSSIAVFTLGKRINTLTITLSYTTANEEGPSWMNRLPRVQSLAKGSMSFRKADDLEDSSNEPEYPPGTLPPIGVPGNFLRRVRDDEDAETPPVRQRKNRRRRRRRGPDDAGGPISQSAIMPQRLQSEEEQKDETEERDKTEPGESPLNKETERSPHPAAVELFLEGDNLIIEDEEGNVLRTDKIGHKSPEERKQQVEAERQKLQKDKSGEFAKSKSQPHEKSEGEDIQQAIGEKAGHPLEKARHRLGKWMGFGKTAAAEPESSGTEKDAGEKKVPKAKHRSAHAYQFGNTIIVEDEEGEVIKKYSIPSSADKPDATAPVRPVIKRMGTWLGMEDEGEPSQAGQKKPDDDDWLKDDGLRFTVADDEGTDQKDSGGKSRRMNKHEFVQQLRNLGPRARRELVEEQTAPEHVKDAAREAERQERRQSASGPSTNERAQMTAAGRQDSDDNDDYTSGSDVTDDEYDATAPGGNVAASLARFRQGTAAEERRGTISPTSRPHSRRDSDDDGTERVPPAQLREAAGLSPRPQQFVMDDTGETPAERRRRLAALGELNNSDNSDSGEDIAVDEDSESDDEIRQIPSKVQFTDDTKTGNSESAASGSSSSQGTPRTRQISWGGEKGRET
ncbi:hypothetical protein FE257_001515 [Aspergillus nanangensis]|uniref:Na+/H+ antiporter Nha1 n=1 Tax=Aspergillus nanangensis TaxID=2582783 RepID=A0AAD4GWY8_ASPNN|nr:hypothetical protein FE257_001515 [Aspergillus nanangensis]